MSIQVFYRSLGELRQINADGGNPKAAQRAVTDHLREAQEHVDGAVLGLLVCAPRKPRSDHNNYILGAMTTPHYQ